MRKALLAGQPTPWPTLLRAARGRAGLWGLAALLWLLTAGNAWAQTYLIGSNQTTCAGTIYDSGGASGNYANNQNLTTVLTPGTAGTKIRLVFTAFATESGYDFLRIYDGPTASAATLLGEYSGSTSPGTITATNGTGQLTLVFTSDVSTRDAGFAATISCVANVPTITSFTPASGAAGTSVNITGTNLNGATAVSFGGVAATTFTVNSGTSISATVPTGAIDGPIRVTTPNGTAVSATSFDAGNPVYLIGSNQTTCAGNIYDSGGSTGNYSNSQNLTTVLTPGTAGQKVQLVFSVFATENTYDFLRIYDGPDATAPLLGEYTGSTSPGTVTATNATGQLTLVFTSDGSSIDAGFAASIGCVTNPPTITSFTPTSGLTGDVVTITGTNFTGATAVSFNNVAAPGFIVNSATSITATVPAGVTTGRIRVTTPVATAISGTNFTVPAPTISSFTPTSGTAGTVVTVSGAAFTGATAVSFGGTAASSFTVNSATSVTATVAAGTFTGPIRVTTPAGTGVSSATFDTGNTLVGSNVTTCSGNIYDSGGPTGNYTNSENRTSVLTPGTAGQKVQLVFSAFATENTYDFLRIYDGPDATAPLIGAYTGSTSPGTVTATNATGQLTLVFTSDGSSVDAGFAASIGCVTNTPTITSFTPTSGAAGTSVTITGTNFTGATAVSFGGTAAPGFTVNSATSITVTVPAGALVGPIRVTTPVATATSSTNFNTGILLIGTNVTTCSGNIYDSGGPTGNYTNSENRTSVLTPGTAGQKVQLVFSAFATENTYDFLRIYDGPDATALLLGEYTGSTSPGTVTATNATGQLTLVFTSDGSSVDAGFAASISCVAPPSCSAPTSISAGSLTPTSASISFTAGIGNTGYTVTYTPQGGSALTATGTASPITLSGLTPGTQYSVTVTGSCSGGQTATSNAATFTTLFTPPANDECASAIGLTSATTCTATTGTTLGATASTAAGSCAGTADDDVWYSFVATGTTHTITVVGNSSFDAVVNLRSGTCPGTTVGSCADATGSGGTETITATSLTPGATYYVRVYSYSSTAPTGTASGGFTICVTEPAPCGPPTALSAGSLTSTSASLSFTAGNGNTSYTVTYTPQGGSATTVTPAPTASPVSLTGLTPNTQYTVSVVGNCSGGQTSTAATTTFTTLAPPPANDDCASATPISSIGVGTCGTAVSGTNVGATASAGAPAPGCASYSGGDVWFSLVVPANGIVQVETSQGSGTSISDSGLALYAGSCGSLTLLSCNDDINSGTNNFSRLRVTGLTPGSTIYARVWEYSNDAFGSFSICAQTDAPSLIVSTPQNVQGSYTNVTITSGGAARLTGPLTVTGTLTVQDGGILATNCQPITGSGSFALQAGGHLRICDAAGISQSGATGAIQLTGTRTFSNDAIYAYNGTASGQVTGSGLPSRARALLVRNSNGLTLSNPLQLGQGILLNGGDLTTNGNALTLLSNANGTALVVNRNGVINGNLTVQRYIDPSLNSGPGYRHYSAPVTNTTVADLATAAFSPVVNPAYNASATPNLVTPFPTVFGYDESRVLTSPATTYGPFDKGWVSPAAPTDAMTPGRGYTVNIAASQTVDFVGTQGNGPVVRPLSRTGGANGGLHLVGNPYPAPIDWSQLTLPTGLDNAMYVYQSNSQYGGVYRSYVNGFGNPRIASGQGFFVRVSPGASAALLTMTNAIRDTSFVTAPSFNRGVETRPVVQLTLSRPGAALADEAYVYFETGATAGVDARYDALKLQHNSGGTPSVYALTAGTELSINGLPELTGRTVVPLGIDVPQAGSYSFEAAQVLNLTTASVYLHDQQTGQYIDLRQQPRYGFTAAAAGAQNARFELVFEPQRPTASAQGLTAASVSLFPNPARGSFALLVPAVPGATQVQATLLNSLGQEVRRQTKALPSSGTRLDVDVTGLATGVYTVRLQAGAAQVTKRVVIE